MFSPDRHGTNEAVCTRVLVGPTTCMPGWTSRDGHPLLVKETAIEGLFRAAQQQVSAACNRRA